MGLNQTRENDTLINLVVLTSILGCVKKITFCPHSKSKKFKFSLSFGEVSSSAFYEGGAIFQILGAL
jgi:hypothetical protein